MSARVPRGFTLLEVVVALAILTMALMAVFNLNSGAIANHAYAKRVTVASLLARSKMIDLEQQLFEDGLPGQDDEESGDFSQEGWPSYKWRARIIAPRTTGVSTEKLLAALFNVPMGGGEGGDGMAGIASMFGGAAGADAAGAGGMAGMMGGAMAGMAQQQLTQFLEQITQTVREVHLTVSWKAGTEVETLDVVTHVVSTGPGSDRNGGGAAGGAGNQAGQPNADPWVRVADGRPISGEPTQQNGQYVDPADPTVPVERRSAWVARQMAGSTRPGVLGGKGLKGGKR
ncbi:MAG: prepilin-type N-terminal cleavage/methylation domain-containing protein [Myxococcota bacterium]|nr:prepilin-type N-terminal cleavage/methylation domain-containing protein [Myxococcota bacterium]